MLRVWSSEKKLHKDWTVGSSLYTWSTKFEARGRILLLNTLRYIPGGVPFILEVIYLQFCAKGMVIHVTLSIQVLFKNVFRFVYRASNSLNVNIRVIIHFLDSVALGYCENWSCHWSVISTTFRDVTACTVLSGTNVNFTLKMEAICLSEMLEPSTRRRILVTHNLCFQLLRIFTKIFYFFEVNCGGRFLFCFQKCCEN
jgi:hypothetical protein